MSALSDPIFEYTTLEWIGELGYPVDPCPQPRLFPWESATERDPFSDVVLVGQLLKASRQFNWAFPLQALPTLRGMLRPKLLSGELSVS